MRGADVIQVAMFSYRTLEERIPQGHSLRKLRAHRRHIVLFPYAGIAGARVIEPNR